MQYLRKSQTHLLSQPAGTPFDHYHDDGNWRSGASCLFVVFVSGNAFLLDTVPLFAWLFVAVVVVFHNVVVVCFAVFWPSVYFIYLFYFIFFLFFFFFFLFFFSFFFFSFFFLLLFCFCLFVFHFFSFSSLPPLTPEPVVQSAFEGLCLHSALSGTVSDVCKTRTM